MNHWTIDKIIRRLNRVERRVSWLGTHVGTNRKCILGSGVDLSIFQDAIVVCVKVLKNEIVMVTVETVKMVMGKILKSLLCNTL